MTAQVADLEEHHPPMDQNILIFMRCFNKCLQKRMVAPPAGLTPPLESFYAYCARDKCVVLQTTFLS